MISKDKEDTVLNQSQKGREQRRLRYNDVNQLTFVNSKYDNLE